MAENTHRVHEFLDLYKQLEDLLEEKYRGSKRRYAGVVLEYLRDEESAPLRDKLEICREIRNLLTHSADLDGQPIVEPSVPVIEGLREAVEALRRPALALDKAVAGSRIMTAELDRKVLRLMEVMDKNGFSHIPVMREGKLYGVFSAGTVFRWQLQHRGKALNQNTTLRDLSGVIELSASRDHYEFLPEDATVQAARVLFQRVRGRNRRVSAIFLTENGRPGERLLGMLTPWDVLGEGEGT